jgi:hypothetical protein
MIKGWLCVSHRSSPVVLGSAKWGGLLVLWCGLLAPWHPAACWFLDGGGPQGVAPGYCVLLTAVMEQLYAMLAVRGPGWVCCPRQAWYGVGFAGYSGSNSMAHGSGCCQGWQLFTNLLRRYDFSVFILRSVMPVSRRFCFRFSVIMCIQPTRAGIGGARLMASCTDTCIILWRVKILCFF